MFQRALEVGILPSEFWSMSLQEIVYTVSYRNKAKNKEIYEMAFLNRLAVLSCFSEKARFPSYSELHGQSDDDESWQNSKAFFKELQERRKKNDSRRT